MGETKRSTIADYIEKVAAMPKSARDYDHDDSPWKNPHVLLHKASAMPPCGCEVDGFGTLPQPVVIRFCPTHALAPKMAALLRFAADKLTPDSGISWLKAEARALLARLEAQ